jgi:hypothetical protein
VFGPGAGGQLERLDLDPRPLDEVLDRLQVQQIVVLLATVGFSGPAKRKRHADDVHEAADLHRVG